jgi:hypothetical protein
LKIILLPFMALRSVALVLFMSLIPPRNISSSSYRWDSLWVSHCVLVSTIPCDAEQLMILCQERWSPGLVVVLLPGKMTSSILERAAALFLSLSRKLGKARRITTGIPISGSMAAFLYRSFSCVEFISASGEIRILNDGDESVVEASLIT